MLPSADVAAAAARFYEQIGLRPVAVSEHFAALEMRGGTHLVIHHDLQNVVLDSVPSDLMVDDIEQGIEMANGYAAEHLEIQTANSEQVASMITNAGAIFVGPWSPVSLGDYCAGSTHVLPTGGCACHSSGLNVRSFLKMMHVVSYTQTAFAEVARKVEVFADAEDLPAHGAAIARRFFPSTPAK